MLLLPSRKSALGDPNMVLSQIHSFLAHSSIKQEHEDNNNTLLDEKNILRTPPPKCRFLWHCESLDKSEPELLMKSVKFFPVSRQFFIADSALVGFSITRDFVYD
jgi:hypothetical protein